MAVPVFWAIAVIPDELKADAAFVLLAVQKTMQPANDGSEVNRLVNGRAAGLGLVVGRDGVVHDSSLILARSWPGSA